MIDPFKKCFDNGQYLAKGSDFADALTGSALAIRNGGTIVLTKSNSLPDPINDIFERKFYAHVYTIGGQAAIDENVRNQVDKLSDNSEYTKAKKIELDEWFTFSEIVTKKGISNLKSLRNQEF